MNIKEKFFRSVAVFGSIVLLTASVAIIFWINQSEEARLALREQFTLEKVNQLRVGADVKALSGQQSDSNEEQLFSEIDALLSVVGSDDIPTE